MGYAPLLPAVAVSLAAVPPPPAPVQWSGRDLTNLSLSELAATKVTAVSKTPEERSKTAAAIHVITRDDIRRSGATTLVELLRLVPGVHVARIHSSQWAVGVRGFTSRLARAQLAVMDGRSLYTPLFAGTYWEVQDTLLEDVERIEVVRGPGGTLWGANAVTGIVNVVTRRASETLGGFVTAGGGTEERAFVRARHGGRIGGGHFRVWGKYADRDAAFREDGSAFDDWRLGSAGFRADWERDGGETVTVQGGAYDGRLGTRASLASYTAPFLRTVETRAPAHGGHLLARWTRPVAGGELTLQTYYDRSAREEPTFREARDTGDVDAQYARHLGRHHVVAGAGYRLSDGRSRGLETLRFVPADRTDYLLTAFLQDEVDVVPERLRLTVGTKAERNSYTGFELQPTLRASWTPSEAYGLWASATRAVRTPSRIERDVEADSPVSPSAPVFFRLQGSPEFETETILALEAGVRVRLAEWVFFDVAAFRNRHPNLLSLEIGRPFEDQGRQITPAVIANGNEGVVAGLEAGVDLRVAPRWMVRSGYSYLNMALEPRPGSTDVSTASSGEGTSPRHRVFVWSSLDLPGGVSLDVRGGWVSALPAVRVDDYASADARAAWRATARLELAVVGRNLLRNRHAEFGGAGAGQLERSVFAEASWQW